MKRFNSMLFLFLALHVLSVFAMDRQSSSGDKKSLCCSECYSDNLVSAIESRNLFEVNSLLFSNIDPNTISRKSGDPVLVEAARVGHAGIVESLLAAKASPNMRRLGSDGALSVVVDHDDICPASKLALIQQLLHAKADPNMRDSRGDTSLFYAIDSVQVMDTLLKAGADMNAGRDDTGSTVLMCAAACGQIEAVERLLREDVLDINAQDDKGNTALIVAALNGSACGEFSFGSSESEEDDGANLVTVDANKLLRRRLKTTALLGFDRVVDRLIRAGAHLDVQSGEGGTALMYAALEGHHDMVQKLLDAGANPNIPWKADGATALMIAAQDEEDEVVAQLLQAGADISVISEKTGNTAFIEGVNSFRIMERLITGCIDQLLFQTDDVDGIIPDQLSECGVLTAIPSEIRVHCMSYLDRQAYGRVKQVCKLLRCDAQQQALKNPHIIDFISFKLWNLLIRINNHGRTALIEACFMQKKYGEVMGEFIPEFEEAVRIVNLLSYLATQKHLREFVEAYLLGKQLRVA